MNSIRNSILVVSPDIPYPPNHGGRVDVWNTLKLLKSLGFRVDLIATGKFEPSVDELKVINETVDNFTYCPRHNRVCDMFSVLPLQVRSRKQLRDIVIQSRYDLTILATEYVYEILRNDSLHSKHMILRVQNNETVYFKELGLAARFGLNKAYYLLESFKFWLLQKAIIGKISNFLFISLDEFQAFRDQHADMNSIFLPTYAALTAPRPISLQSMNVVFVGSFFMINNMEGILWYLESVHPLLMDIDDYKLILAGNSKGQDISWLHRACSQFGNIVIYDSPEDLEPIYSQGAVFVNPMLHGAGVKLKTIEAIQNSLPVVSTTVGNQGTGLRPDIDILVADDPASYASQIRKLLNDKEYATSIVETGQRTLTTHLNQPSILRDYLDSLLHT